MPTIQVNSYWNRIAFVDGMAIATVLAGTVLILVCALASWDRGDGSPTCTVGELMLLGGAAMYLLAPPVVHIYHDNIWGALGSFALRGGMLALGYAITARSSGDYFLLALGAIASAMILDGTLLAKTTRRLPTPDRAQGRPFVLVDQHSLTVGLRGLF